MNNEQTTLLKTSFALIQSNSKELGLSFYKNLFQVAPQLRPLFNADIETQVDKFFQIITLVVNNCEHVNILEKEILTLGQKHIQYGVLPEHYSLVVDVLIKTLENFMKEQFTSAIKKAWSDILINVTNIMQTGKPTV